VSKFLKLLRNISLLETMFRWVEAGCSGKFTKKSGLFKRQGNDPIIVVSR
jgi:hypothetical protein